MLKCRNLYSGSSSKRQEPIYAKVKKGIRFADDVGDEGRCESDLIKRKLQNQYLIELVIKFD